MAGLFVHLMPVFGVVLAWVFLGERLAPYHVVGIALILTGIGITSRRARGARLRRAPTDDGRRGDDGGRLLARPQRRGRAASR